MWVPVFIEALGVILVVGYLIWYFGSIRTMRWYALITSFIGWLFAFSIIFLLPNDITSALYKTCLNETMANETISELEPSPTPLNEKECEPPVALVSDGFLLLIWRANYWTAFMLSWAIAPIMQSYVLSGGFTIWQKSWQSIKENLILYGVLLLLGTAMMIYIGVEKNFQFEAMMGFAMAMANAYGLFMVICFLGHGLVQLPKTTWFRGNRKVVLRQLEFKASTYKENLEEANIDLIDSIRKVNTMAREIPLHHEFRPYVDTIISKCPPNRERHGFSTEIDTTDVTVKKLISLHSEITDSVRLKTRAEIQYHTLLLEAFKIQDILDNRNNASKLYRSTLWKKKSHTSREKLARSLEWYFYVIFQPILFRLFGLIFAILSIMIVWCEVTIFSENPVLSIFNLIIHSEFIGNFGITFVAFMTLSYMCSCAYSSLMKVRIFNYYYLVGNHQTDENSLLFCAAYLSRLTFPLSYNFIFITGVDRTVFAQVLGPMEILPIFGLSFNTYLPILIAVVCFLFAFDIFGRLLALCHIQKFRFDEDFSHASIDEGQELIRQARERAERNPDLFFQGFSSAPPERETGKTSRSKSTRQSAKFERKVQEESEENLTVVDKGWNFWRRLKEKRQSVRLPKSSSDTRMTTELLPKRSDKEKAPDIDEVDEILDFDLHMTPSSSTTFAPSSTYAPRKGRPITDMFSDV